MAIILSPLINVNDVEKTAAAELDFLHAALPARADVAPRYDKAPQSPLNDYFHLPTIKTSDKAKTAAQINLKPLGIKELATEQGDILKDLGFK